MCKTSTLETVKHYLQKLPYANGGGALFIDWEPQGCDGSKMSEMQPQPESQKGVCVCVLMGVN